MSRLHAFIAAFLFACALPSPAADENVRRVTVTPGADGYYCEAVMVVPVSVTTAFSTMTDFDTMAKWVPNLRQSRVTKREGNVVWIEQVGVAQFGPLSVDFSSERRLELSPPRIITSELVKGTVKRYRSTLYLTPDRGGTKVTYRVEIDPGPIVGLVVSAEFIRHEISEQFAAIADEMVRRELASAR